MTIKLLFFILLARIVTARNILNKDPVKQEEYDEIRICRTPNCTLVQDFRQVQVAKAPPSAQRIPICTYNPYNCGCFYPLPYAQAQPAQQAQPASSSSLSILPTPYPRPYPLPYPGCCPKIYSPVCCTVIPGAKCNSYPTYSASSAQPASSGAAYKKTYSSQCEADNAGACNCSPGSCESTGGGCGYNPVCCTKISGATCSDSPGSNLNAAVGAFSIDPSARRVTYRNNCEAQKAGACKCTSGSCSYTCLYCLGSSTDGGRRHLLDEDVVSEEVSEEVHTCESLQQKYEPCCEEYKAQERESLCDIADKFGIDCAMLEAFHGKSEVAEGDILQICV